MKLVLAICLSGLIIAGSRAAWSEPVRTGRYTSVSTDPTEAQQDPLDVVITTHLPAHFKTVQEALAFLLERSGYRLAPHIAFDPATAQLLALPLPEVHRQLGPLRLQAALETLAGQAYVLVVDPVHRLVSFELRPAYRPLVTDPQEVPHRD